MSKKPDWRSCGNYEMLIEPGGHIYFSPTNVEFVCVLCGAGAPDCDEIVRHFLFECETAREEWR